MPIQVIEGRPRRVSVTEQLLHGGLSGGLNAVQQHQENTALKNRGIDLAGVRDPNTRQQIIAQELQYGRNRRMAEGSPSILGQGEEGQNQPQMDPERNRDFVEQERPQRQPLPKFNQKAGAPVSEREQGEYSNFPQEATTGQKEPIKSPTQIKKEAFDLHRQSLNTANPISQSDALAHLDSLNDLNRKHNQDIEAERIIRENAQEKYGNQADIALQKVLGENQIPSDEMRGIFQKEAEEAAKSGMSAADFTKHMGKKVTQFSDMLDKAKTSPKPERIHNKFYNKIMGNSRDSAKMREDIKFKVQPLLDLGLFDEARNILGNDVGYYPEEVENIISSLGENSKKTVAKLPEIKKIEPSFGQRAKQMGGSLAASVIGGPLAGAAANILGEPDAYYTPMQEMEIHENISEALAKDPSANLILLRKAYEDKGVDWNTFLDGVNKARQQGVFEPDPQQENMFETLTSPPLNGLDSLLYGLGFIGR